MARRPGSEDKAFSRAELNELHRNLSMLSPASVIEFYRKTHGECAAERRPGPKTMQQLVAAWKILRKWKWR